MRNGKENVLPQRQAAAQGRNCRVLAVALGPLSPGQLVLNPQLRRGWSRGGGGGVGREQQAPGSVTQSQPAFWAQSRVPRLPRCWRSPLFSQTLVSNHCKRLTLF